MSRKYREYKANLIELYGHEGKFPSYKMTLSKYKRIKRMVQKKEKQGKKFWRRILQEADRVCYIDGIVLEKMRKQNRMKSDKN